VSKLRVHALTLSVDGYVAGPDQTLDTPMGIGTEHLHDWMFPTRTWHQIVGEPGGSDGVDERFAAEGFEGIGATIMGRNMFGPVRGEWAPVAGEQWRGWWGPDPVYHHPVFVLTHYAHDPIEMEGGTTFFFVTDGIESALEQARTAAGAQDIRLGGGAATVRQYLRAGLIDELHLVISPLLLGGGERLFDDDLGDAATGYEVVEVVPGEGATHVRLTRR
jgi:dihydrofolate reductase